MTFGTIGQQLDDYQSFAGYGKLQNKASGCLFFDIHNIKATSFFIDNMTLLLKGAFKKSPFA